MWNLENLYAYATDVFSPYVHDVTSNHDNMKQKILQVLPYLLFVFVLSITLPSALVCMILLSYPFVTTPPAYEMYFWAAMWLAVSPVPYGLVDTLIYHGAILLLFYLHTTSSHIPSHIISVMSYVGKNVFVSGVDMLKRLTLKLQEAYDQNLAT